DSEELQSRHDGQVRFLNALRRYGFKVWTKSVVEHYDAKSEQTVMKGNIDVELAVDAMTLCSAGRIDELILFSADGDFSYMLDRLHFLYGVITTVIGPNQKTSLDLRDKCDRFVPLEEVSSGFMEKKQFTNGLRQEAVGIQ
ncbi:MAG: NYN domain-containing protein, partial [Candidatus Paceibacterota bacterium]